MAAQAAGKSLNQWATEVLEDAVQPGVVIPPVSTEEQLTYRLDGDQIVVEKQPGVVWLTLAVASQPRGRI